MTNLAGRPNGRGKQPQATTLHQRITIREVAQRAGVAISSVSRVLSKHPHVSDELRIRVEAAAQALGYRPNYVAHSLRRGDTASVGFLVGTISNPIMADISVSVSDVLASHGYATLLVCSQNDPAADLDYLHFLAQRQVSGVIISSAANGPDDGLRLLLQELAMPTVMLDRDRVDTPYVSAVLSDHAAGMEAAVLHLIEQGHRRIGLVGGPEYFPPAARRLQGYYQAFQTAGVEPDPALVRAQGMSKQVGYAETHHLLNLAQPPTALIAGGNLILSGVLQAVKEQGLAIGRALALVGCDDTELTRLHSPSITVIERDFAHMGQVAAELLLETMDQESGRSVMLPTRLLIRESSLGAPI
jgi:LacI family transcriptional regulator